MYRVSPFTYLVSAILSVGVANTTVRCSAIELLHFDPLPNTTCASYMSSYISSDGGYLTNPGAIADCTFCPLSDTNTFLNQLDSNYSDRWRNFGLLWVYVVFNVGMAVLLYWLLRVPKKTNSEKVKRGKVVDPMQVVVTGEKE
jgi:ATP-binding cassette subfamily G (WHITE) protein 2 (PDR)